MADEMVLATQKWLNQTYGNVSGFGSVPENGKTGWDTVYGLIRAAQHEMGIAGLVNNWGPGSRQKWDSKYRNNFKVGYKHNVVKILQGGFYCKGINPGGFTGTASSETINAIGTMKQDAGLTDISNVPDSDFMGALLSMKQFNLVLGGDPKVQAMQRELNGSYIKYFVADDSLGYLPADGIFQRETNAALIYALQAEEGLAVGKANGVYGPKTQELTPTIKPGTVSKFVKIAKWGLYANGFNKNGDFSTSYGITDVAEVESFIEFMALPSTTNIDLTVFMSLLTSNGNTDRSSKAVDTSTQLDAKTVGILKKAGYSIIGRYLSGTVGVGPSKRPKNLTSKELQTIFDAGMSVFPIFQEGAPIETDYFTVEQAQIDANKALAALYSLGFKFGTVVYFAVDGDILGADIDGSVGVYFKKVHSIVNGAGYKTGIYGTRNVCNHIIDAGYASNAFVSNMSSGYSGNMGFRMPEKWSFDQFVEEEVGGVAIDKDGTTSSRSTAVNSVDTGSNGLLLAVKNVLSAMPFTSDLSGKISLSHKKLTIKGTNGFIGAKLTYDDDLSVSIKHGTTLSIEGNSVDTSKMEELIKNLIDKWGQGFVTVNDVVNQCNKLAKKIGNGTLYIGVAEPDPDFGNAIGIRFAVESSYQKNVENVIIEQSYGLILDMYVKDGLAPSYVTSSDFGKALNGFENIIDDKVETGLVAGIGYACGIMIPVGITLIISAGVGTAALSALPEVGGQYSIIRALSSAVS